MKFLVETCIVVNKNYPLQQHFMAQGIQPDSIQQILHIAERTHKIFNILTQIYTPVLDPSCLSDDIVLNSANISNIKPVSAPRWPGVPHLLSCPVPVLDHQNLEYNRDSTPMPSLDPSWSSAGWNCPALRSSGLPWHSSFCTWYK